MTVRAVVVMVQGDVPGGEGAGVMLRPRRRLWLARREGGLRSGNCPQRASLAIRPTLRGRASRFPSAKLKLFPGGCRPMWGWCMCGDVVMYFCLLSVVTVSVHRLLVTHRQC